MHRFTVRRQRLIEAQNSDADGTELVALSAYETAQGQSDYGEGVSGLVRAFAPPAPATYW